MENDKKEAIIILPQDLREGSASALALCELFVSRLLEASNYPVNIRVDTKNSAAYSSEPRIREVVNILLKTRKLQAFYEQLKALLIDGQYLLCVKEGVPNSFGILEVTTFPDFEWIIERSEESGPI